MSLFIFILHIFLISGIFVSGMLVGVQNAERIKRKVVNLKFLKKRK